MAVEDGTAGTIGEDEKVMRRGGCFNLGWGCLSVFVGLGLLVPAGLFF
jgi:hypothetical protein